MTTLRQDLADKRVKVVNRVYSDSSGVPYMIMNLNNNARKYKLEVIYIPLPSANYRPREQRLVLEDHLDDSRVNPVRTSSLKRRGLFKLISKN